MADSKAATARELTADVEKAQHIATMEQQQVHAARDAQAAQAAQAAQLQAMQAQHAALQQQMQQMQAGGCLLYTSPSPRDAHES
eukprot:7325660-Prymnesium_polylepis.2